MNISKTTAMSIVMELKNIIGYDITLMDSTCHILACTNAERIGDYHAATRKMLDENLSVLIVCSDDEYMGTHSGVNLPIAVDGQVIGVVGITGETNEVVKYGQIIKKVVEILLMDEYRKEQKRLSRNAKSRFIQDWIFNDGMNGSELFLKHGMQVGIDISVSRRIAVASVEANSNEVGGIWNNQTLSDQITSSIRKTLSIEDGGMIISYGSNFILLLHEREDEEIKRLMEVIRKKLAVEFDIIWKVGVDSFPVSWNQAHAGYLRAEKALYGTSSFTSGETVFYKDITMEIFIHDVPQATKREFIARIFYGYNSEQIRQMSLMLKTLFECNGSLLQTSQKLFMHKNTLQYKLNKMMEQTGFDPRDMIDSSLFYIAMAFYEDLS